jgi:hypothetical protein
MKGFDPRWRDLPEWILGITREIWEDRGLSTLHRHYGPDVLVRGSAGITQGVDAVIAHTAEALAATPDLLILGEDVIWSGNEDDGFLSSHRSVELLPERDGEGRPTGRVLRERVIADCFCLDGQIADEWLVFDVGARCRQRGLHPREAAAQEIAAEGGPESAVRPFTWRDDRPGPYLGKGDDSEWGRRHEDLLRRVVAADFAALPRIYDRAVQLELPGGRTEHGVAEADRFWMALRAALPSAELVIDHRIGREDPLLPPRSALRWSLVGRHEGKGLFGPPSGAELHLRGASHAEWGPRGLRRDYVLFDEVHVWKQILLHKG